MSPKTAVILETYPCHAGAEAIAFGMIAREREIAGILRSQGYRAHGFKPTRSAQPSAIGPEDAAWHFVPVDPGSEALADNKLTCHALEESIASLRPEVLLLRGAGTVLGQRVAERCSSARTGVLVSGRYRTSTLTTADVVFTETPAQESFLRKRLAAHRLIRLPKFVRNDFFDIPVDAEKHHDVAVVGKFEPHKNHRALLPLLQAGYSVVFLGSGRLLEPFRALAEGLPGRATFLGDVDPATVLTTLSASRLLAHPSLSEGFPRAVTEGMAAGLPIVALRSTLSWPLVDGGNSLLVRETDILAAVQRVLDDDELRSALGSEARRTAAREFSRDALREAVLAGVRVLTEPRGHRSMPYRHTPSSRARRAAWDLTTRSAAPIRAVQRTVQRVRSWRTQ